MLKEIDYRRIDEEVRKELPGEVVSQSSQRVYTTTRSNGDNRYQISGESWTVENPSPKDVAAVINGLFAPGNHMATLAVKNTVFDSGEYVGDCVFVRTAILEKDDPDIKEGKYVVEALLVYGRDKDNGINNPNFKTEQYRTYTNDIDEVTEIFMDFVSGVVPDIRSWQLQEY
jgi:hypothetical protein